MYYSISKHAFNRYLHIQSKFFPIIMFTILIRTSFLFCQHIDYGSKMKEILEFLDLSSPYPNSEPSEELEGEG
jgi:hypothetical protein